MANAMQNVRNSKTWLSGSSLARHSKNMAFYGFSQSMRTNHSGHSFLNYVLLDTDGLAWELSPTHQVDLEVGMVRSLGRPIHFPGGAQPKADSNCWFTRGSLCSRGESSRNSEAEKKL